jgi:hypothetical protein
VHFSEWVSFYTVSQGGREGGREGRREEGRKEGRKGGAGCVLGKG